MSMNIDTVYKHTKHQKPILHINSPEANWPHLPNQSGLEATTQNRPAKQQQQLSRWQLWTHRPDGTGPTTSGDVIRQCVTETPAEVPAIKESSWTAEATARADPRAVGSTSGGLKPGSRHSRCNRLRCPLARMSGLQCFNMGHNGHGINLYGVSMTLMGN